MKKIVLILFLLFSFNLAFAKNSNQTKMPTDEQIKAVIDKYDFSDEEKEYVFIQTKEKLKEIYNAKNILPEVEKTDRNIDMPEPKLEKKKLKSNFNFL